MTVSLATADLHDVWTGGGITIAVGAGGTILQNQGALWTPMSSPATDIFENIGKSTSNFTLQNSLISSFVPGS